MQMKVFNKEGKEVELTTKEYVEENFSKKGEVQNYIFKEFYIYDKYGISDPIEGLKKIYSEIPKGNSKPTFVWLGCGSQYLAIIQATDDKYGSAVIFGYASTNITFIRLVNGVWY